MKININEKFNLIEKLEDLSTAVTDHAEANNICVRGIYEFKKDVNPRTFSSFVNMLNTYSWISEVDSFLGDYKTFISENVLGVQLESILNSLESSQHRATYEPAIAAISKLVPMNESKIKSNLHLIKGFTFIPSLRAFLESYEKDAFAVTKTITAEVEKSHVSPVMMTENGYVFNLNDVNYEMNADMTNIKKFEGNVSSKYAFGLNSLSRFVLENDNEFIMNTKAGTIKIVATDEGSNRFFIGENEFFGKQSIATALNVTKVVDYFDKNTKSVLEFMFDNANEYVVIECVKNIKTVNENIKLSFIKLADNTVLLNQVNKFERKNEMIEVTGDNFDSIVESFAKGYKLDVIHILENIKVNIKAVEFAKKVKSIDISQVIYNAEEVFNAIDEANDFYNDMTINEQEDCHKSLNILDSKSSKVTNEKVTFLLEAKAKYKRSTEEGTHKVISLLNIELKNALGYTGRVNEAEIELGELSTDAEEYAISKGLHVTGADEVVYVSGDKKVLMSFLKDLTTKFNWAKQNWSKLVKESNNDYVEEIGDLEELIYDQGNMRTTSMWDDEAEDLLQDRDTWGELEEPELVHVIDMARAFMKKHKIKESTNENEMMSDAEIEESMAESGKMKVTDLVKYMKAHHGGCYDVKRAREIAKELVKTM